MNTTYEIYDHEKQHVRATFPYGITEEERRFFEALGYMVRRHEFHEDNGWGGRS